MHFEKYARIYIDLYRDKNGTADLLRKMPGIRIKGCRITGVRLYLYWHQKFLKVSDCPRISRRPINGP
jgi:hypothetical protein